MEHVKALSSPSHLMMRYVAIHVLMEHVKARETMNTNEIAKVAIHVLMEHVKAPNASPPNAALRRNPRAHGTREGSEGTDMAKFASVAIHVLMEHVKAQGIRWGS